MRSKHTDPAYDASTAASEKEKKITEAIAFYKDRHDGTDPWTITRVAGEFDVPYGTLWHRINGRKTNASSHESQQLLRGGEEAELLDWVQAMSKTGIPLSPRLLTQAASSIAKRRDPNVSVGIHWSERFRKRHTEFLESKIDCHLPKSRARAVTPEMIDEWFELVSLEPLDNINCSLASS